MRDAAKADLDAAREALRRSEEAVRGGACTLAAQGAQEICARELEGYFAANRAYLEAIHASLREIHESPRPEDSGEVCRMIRELWADKQRVVSSTANYIGRNKDFQQVHNALLKHMDQVWKCFQAIYASLGGDIADLHRK